MHRTSSITVKVLISSHAFAPHIGGIETVSGLLADEFVRLGHVVVVVTQTPAEGKDDFPYRVVRRPSFRELVAAIKWCDIYWQNNLSLRTLWPALLVTKPVVITHQGSYCRAPGGLDLVQRLKHAIVGRTTSVAISQAVAAAFQTRSTVIPNPYDARQFPWQAPDGVRPGDLIFLGRLVSEKGVDLLLHALALLQGRNIFASLTIVGSGPEQVALEELSAKLGLGEQVTFSGPKRGEELRALLLQNKILVVPSRYDEPFGVVALEGIACGCVVVGSRGGGLPEAIGRCGLTFPNADATALAGALEMLLSSPNEQDRLLAQAPDHLAKFHPAVIAESYLAIFRARLS